MRKKHEVQKDLTSALAKVKELTGKEDKKTELEAATADVIKFTGELNEITITDAADRALIAAVGSREMRAAAKRFSFTKFLRQISDGKVTLDGVELEMSQEARKEAAAAGIILQGHGIPYSLLANRSVSIPRNDFDGMTAGTPGDGGDLIATELQYQEALRNRLVLTSCGARFIGGLTGNLRLIQGNAITMGWQGENVKGGDTKKTFTTRDVSPLRAFVNVPISKQLIIQSSWDVENMVMVDIVNAHAELLDTAALIGDGQNSSPLGILYDPDIKGYAIGENGGAISWKAVVGLETVIASQNADVESMHYVSNSKVRGAMKTTLKTAGVSGYILEGTETNGYQMHTTNILPSNLIKGTSGNCSPMIFGDWSNMHVFQWGGLDFVYDPYSRKLEGADEITLNCYHNIFIKRKESFAVCKDIVTD
jgi:HK97 family phage major capsid protein